jgi:hypothetical protein
LIPYQLSEQLGEAHSKKFGFGRINAAKAVQAARAKL